MALITIPYHYTCPYCWEKIESIADLSVDQQCFVEDCRVCCHPIEISFTVTGNDLINLAINKAT